MPTSCPILQKSSEQEGDKNTSALAGPSLIRPQQLHNEYPHLHMGIASTRWCRVKPAQVHAMKYFSTFTCFPRRREMPYERPSSIHKPQAPLTLSTHPNGRPDEASPLTVWAHNPPPASVLDTALYCAGIHHPAIRKPCEGNCALASLLDNPKCGGRNDVAASTQARLLTCGVQLRWYNNLCVCCAGTLGPHRSKHACRREFVQNK